MRRRTERVDADRCLLCVICCVVHRDTKLPAIHRRACVRACVCLCVDVNFCHSYGEGCSQGRGICHHFCSRLWLQKQENWVWGITGCGCSLAGPPSDRTQSNAPPSDRTQLNAPPSDRTQSNAPPGPNQTHRIHLTTTCQLSSSCCITVGRLA